MRETHFVKCAVYPATQYKLENPQEIPLPPRHHYEFVVQPDGSLALVEWTANNTRDVQT